MIKTSETEYKLKSLSEDFKSLSEDDKAKAILDDIEYGCIGEDLNKLSEDDKKRRCELLSCINKTIDIADNIKELISLYKKYFADYEAISGLMYKSKDLKMSYIDFIKTFIIKPYYSDKIAQQPALRLVDNKKPESKKLEAVKAANNMPKTAKDIINNCNSTSAKKKQNKQHMNQNVNMVVVNQNNEPANIYPEMSLDQKGELLKMHVNFVPGVIATESEVDALLRLVEGKMLKAKLKEYNASCNPQHPVLTQTTKYKFDKTVYRYAFYSESIDPNKCILVLYDTNTMYTPQGPGNNLSISVVNSNEVM